MPTQTQKVLVFCLSGLGDTILASPALAVLASHPDRFQLTLLTMFESVREYLIDQQFTDDVRWVDFLKNSVTRNLAAVFQLRSEHFDASVIPYAMNRLEYNVMGWLVGSRRRIGFRYRRQRRLNLPWLNHDVLDEDPRRHAVEENLRWAARLADQPAENLPRDLVYRLSDEAMRQGDEFLKTNGLDRSSPLIGIHAGCNTIKNQQCRCWPADRFGLLIEKLASQVPSVRFLLFEGPQDAAMTAAISRQTRKFIVARSLPMRVVGTLIRQCRLFISNDSGLMHVAAANRVPVVAIFGPTNPTWVHPWETRHAVVRRKLPCSPCFYYSSRPLGCPAHLNYSCVRELAVEEVERAAIQLLQPPRT